MVGSMPAPASAAPTAGSNGAATTCGRYRTGVRSASAGRPVAASCAGVSAAAIATVSPCWASSSTAGPVSGPSANRVAPRVDSTPRIWSTMLAAPRVAMVLRPGSPTRCSASRSVCANTVDTTHIRVASSRSRSSQVTAASVPLPGRTGVPGPMSGPSLTTYPAVMALTVMSRSGSTARHRVRLRSPRESTAGRVAKSTAASSVSNRPPGASDTASSSSTNRTGVVPPGAPAASRGLSASGQNTVYRTGAEMSGGTTELSAAPESAPSPGTPSTGSRNRESSSRAGAP
ncbi:hypothetical protein KEK_10678 [Mycolicibacterium thermoresistibile ATCC 19527]|uniref:Uncharacterized protein n=1 Tax=Mycolicibacterium thermoresistibile (strain ATCC 19527 / DSM 44167 / CIP 105390 / JCM 6362 / NCTC 10409 / 316) TaxID=1078020 RepID=G7CIM4_MYCT3|nr:hypothetical protein KEK_10678 [Mycolicibacterium thermoresistibile ATCC 19527]